ncbi:MAG TPA: Crp/Fnr family transcriptional regulator [Blastocatellia bacterium]|jgi:CRP-like cAMP-binding protein
MANQSKRDAPTANKLLAALSPTEFERLRTSVETVRLHLGQIIYNQGEPIREAYFPESGTISLLSVTEDGLSIEVAIVGNEGMVGLPVPLGITTALFQTVVQVQGSAAKITARVLTEEFRRTGVLHDMLLRHSYALLAQVSQTAKCNAFHTVERRLCRWLLMTADRVEADSFKLTQQFLSSMLGAARQRVNIVIRSLREAGLIDYVRGEMTIVDRKRVESASCECYQAVKDAYDEAFGRSIWPS